MPGALHKSQLHIVNAIYTMSFLLFQVKTSQPNGDPKDFKHSYDQPFENQRSLLQTLSTQIEPRCQDNDCTISHTFTVQLKEECFSDEMSKSSTSDIASGIVIKKNKPIHSSSTSNSQSTPDMVSNQNTQSKSGLKRRLSERPNLPLSVGK